MSSFAGNKRPADSESDSDEDIPISELLRRQAAKAAAANPPPVKKPKLPVKSSSSSVVKKESSSSSGKSSSSSSSKPKPKASASPLVKKEVKMNTPNTSSEFYDQTLKGGLVQQLLCRWWYAQEWPLDSDVHAPPLNKGYEPLDGFKGVYICTKMDNLGHILDTRDKTNCPCFSVFVRKPAEELQRMCVKAYETQIEQLSAHYKELARGHKATGKEIAPPQGNEDYGLVHRRTLAALRVDLSRVRKVNTAKADAEAAKWAKKLGL